MFYTQDGTIIHQTGEFQSTVNPHHDITEVNFVDIPYGSTNGFDIVKIDVETKKPILEATPVYESPEQKHIRELEDALLLQAENEIGGIL